MNKYQLLNKNLVYVIYAMQILYVVYMCVAQFTFRNSNILNIIID